MEQPQKIALDFAKQGGLVTVVTVDAEGGEVLMVAYMNEEAFRLTLETGLVHYFSRSRQKLWKKGESSGNMQKVREIRVDCDQDALVIRAEQTGPACHDGYRSCFYRVVGADGSLRTAAERLMTKDEMYGSKS
jgi:phosphoribosyl-AMP cyclohydrolase